MNLKNLRTSYDNLLKAFTEAGVTLNESQQKTLDTFMVSLEQKLNETRDNAIKATKEVVEKRMDAEYKEIVESLVKHMHENAELATKVQNKTNSLNENKDIADKVDSYLDLYLEEVLPTKTIVDYDRMQKLETIHESLKSMLTVSEADVEAKNDEEMKKISESKTSLEKTIRDLEKKLDKVVSENKEMKTKADKLEAKMLVEEKTKDLPDVEAQKVKECFTNATKDEVNSKYGEVLEKVQDDLEKERAQAAQDTEDAVITDKPSKEGPADYGSEEDLTLERAITDIIGDDYSDPKTTDGTEELEETESSDEVTENSTEEELEESYGVADSVIDGGMMKYWLSKC